LKNKRLAIFLIILVFLALVVVLSSAVFSLSSVETNFLSTTNVLSNCEDAIVESGNFKFGENIFFSSKSKYIQNLEKANPYLRVVSLETVFPNKFVINAVERNETYVIKLANNKYAKTDENLKILSISSVFQNSTSNGIVVDGSDLANQTDLTAGDFFKVEDNYLTTIFNCFREWNLSYSAIKSKIESIELGYNGDSNRLLVNMRSGVQIIVRNAKQGLSDKLNLAFSIYDTDTDTQTGEPVDYTKSGIIEVFENETKIYASYRQV
jgi:hypothetical protein